MANADGLRSLLRDLLHPYLSIRVEERQNTQKKAHDGKQKQRLFDVNDPVYVKNFHAGDKWLPGEVLKVLVLVLTW